MKKRIVSFLLMAVILLGFVPNAHAYQFTYGEEVEVMFVGNLETGESYLKKQDERVLPVASISKLMTYLVVKDEIAKGNLKLEDTVKINEEMSEFNQAGYSSMSLRVGEEISVKDLLEGIMIVSGNDAAVALAIKAGGSVQNFVKMMNQKAMEVGLAKSTFINPTGITENAGESNEKFNAMTARDIFNLSRHILLKYPETEEYGKTPVLIQTDRNFVQESTLPNREMKSMKGLKTGYEDNAGYTFAGLFDLKEENEKFDMRIITVQMGADTTYMREKTNEEMVKFVLENFIHREIVNKDIPVIDIYDDTAKERYINLYPEKSFTKLLPKNDSIEMKYTLIEDNKAPYEDGQTLGHLSLSYQGEEIAKINLVNRGAVEKAGFFSNLIRSLEEFFENLLVFLF